MNRNTASWKCRHVLAAVAACGGVAMAFGKPQAKPAVPAINQGQRVTNKLSSVLRHLVSSPGGRPQLVITPSARAAQGWFSQIVIAGHPAQVKKLRITELDMRAKNVRVDVPFLMREGKITTLASSTSLRAVITENDLTRMLALGKSTGAMGLKVKFMGGGLIRVAGNWQWSWFSGPVVGVGRLHLLPAHKVNFDILSLKLNGAEVPMFVKNKFSDNLNPVIDYTDLPFRPKFKALRFSGSKAILTA